MAIRNPNLDEEIIAYDKLQTDEINGLIESGGDVNNKYVKFADGTAIVKIYRNIPLNDMVDVIVTLPIGIVSSGTVSFAGQAGSNIDYKKALVGLGGFVDGTKLTIFKTVTSPVQAGVQTITVIGNWK